MPPSSCQPKIIFFLRSDAGITQQYSTWRKGGDKKDPYLLLSEEDPDEEEDEEDGSLFRFRLLSELFLKWSSEVDRSAVLLEKTSIPVGGGKEDKRQGVSGKKWNETHSWEFYQVIPFLNKGPPAKRDGFFFLYFFVVNNMQT